MVPDKMLLVDKVFKPLGLISWKDAYKKMATDKAFFILEPDVLQLKHRIVPFDIKVRYSKENIILRDNGTCQYCGKKCQGNNATIDHVFPESRGGETSFLNCVLACEQCNSNKRNKTPEEAGMKLLRQPTKLTFFSLLHLDLGQNILDKFHDWMRSACEVA